MLSTALIRFQLLPEAQRPYLYRLVPPFPISPYLNRLSPSLYRYLTEAQAKQQAELNLRVYRCQEARLDLQDCIFHHRF